jgi:FMN hydrolase / 5-amino-6-(5-phospho-D-ribitylamino)uracil phosphatase
VIRYVVFDADETLIDLSAAVRGGLLAVLAELRGLTPAAAGLSLADLESDWVAVYPGLADAPVMEIRRAALARSVARVGLESELERIAELFFARRFALSRPFAEVPGVLAALRRSYRIGFATNGNSRAALCGMDGLFDFEVYAFRDGVPQKPAPGFYAAVLAAAGCAAEDAVYVGDSWEHDVVAARAAGLSAVWLNRAGAPLPAGGVADAEIRSLADLPAVLARPGWGRPFTRSGIAG